MIRLWHKKTPEKYPGRLGFGNAFVQASLMISRGTRFASPRLVASVMGTIELVPATLDS